MEITLSNGNAIRGDFIVKAVLRTDLVPVPVTLEATIRYDEDVAPLLVEGMKVQAGPGSPDLRIIWSSPDSGRFGQMQGQRKVGVIKFTALLDSCAAIAFRRKTAVIKEGATLAGIYRACGATVVVDQDIAISRFSCFAGGVPSYNVAVALQEAAGALVWQYKTQRLKFMRLPDLFLQVPVEVLAEDDTERVSSGFLERHEVPWFYSCAPDGSLIQGNRTKTRAALFTPLKDATALNNMTRALVHSRTFTGRLDITLNAGDVISVAGVPLVVVTAAHLYESGTDGANSDQYSRLWLSALE